MGLLHEATRRSCHRMASAGGRRRRFHRTHTRRGACVDRATGRCPRNAQTLPCGQWRHHHNHRPTEKAAVVAGRQRDVGGLQRAALRGPAQGGDAGRVRAPHARVIAQANDRSPIGGPPCLTSILSFYLRSPSKSTSSISAIRLMAAGASDISDPAASKDQSSKARCCWAAPAGCSCAATTYWRFEARITLETDDKQQIYMNWKAFRHGPKEVIDRLNRDE